MTEPDKFERARLRMLDLIDQQVRHEVIRQLPAVIRTAQDFARTMDRVNAVTGDDWQAPDLSALIGKDDDADD